MSATPWTPGPWVLFHQGKTIQVQKGARAINSAAIVHWAGFDCIERPLTENLANAVLIAEAPAMAEALEKAIPVIAEVANIERRTRIIGRPDPTEVQDLLTQARALLARIRGDAP